MENFYGELNKENFMGFVFLKQMEQQLETLISIKNKADSEYGYHYLGELDSIFNLAQATVAHLLNVYKV